MQKILGAREEFTRWCDAAVKSFQTAVNGILLISHLPQCCFQRFIRIVVERQEKRNSTVRFELANRK